MAANRYIAAIQDLDLERLKSMVEQDPKWLTWAEPSGKNALHYVCGLKFKEDAEKEEKSLGIVKFLLKKGMNINSIHRIPDPNCGYFPGTPLWYAYSRGPKEKLY